MLDMGIVDRLTVRVLVDDTAQYDSDLQAVHGISFLVDATAGEVSRRYLVDVGQSATLLLDNMARLGIEPSSVDGVIITHCHFDHTGGLAEVIRSTGRGDLPVIAHPDVFRLHFAMKPHLRHVGIRGADQARALKKAGARLFLSRDPLVLMEGLATTGEVPRVTGFERPGLDVWTLEDGRLKPDLMVDDVSLLVKTSQGLVVITGCSHAGIVNITQHAVDLAGESRIRAILGGLHLLKAPEDVVDLTISHLLDAGVGMVSAGHCTGTVAKERLRTAFGDAWREMHAGKAFQF